VRTICGAIADDSIFDAHLAIPAVAESSGAAVAVSDEEALEAETLLSTTEGLFVEPSSATAVAGLRKLVQRGVIDRKSRVCCLLTGTGFKDLRAAGGRVHVPPLMAADELPHRR
jgi:threonine synthase